MELDRLIRAISGVALLSSALALAKSDVPRVAAAGPTLAAVGGGCTDGNPTVLCVQNGRFRVKVDWKNPYDGGSTGVGTAIQLTNETGYFWFFQDTNVELMLKILDGRATNGKFWVLFGALSDVEYTITITDTVTSAVKTYYNPPQHLGSFIDIEAFSGRPAAAQLVQMGDLPGTEAFWPGATERLPRESRARAPSAADASIDPQAACATLGPILCLNQSRFQVQVAWHDPYGGSSGVGTAVQLTSDTGYFWFFVSTNAELVIKVLDGRLLNGHFWVLYGALSDVEYTITVTDTKTSAVKTYYNPPKHLGSAIDILAFTEAAELVINPLSLPSGVVNTAYPTTTFSQTGGTGAITWSLTGTLPTGMTFSPLGILSGTPTQLGSFPIAVTATDAGGLKGSRNYTLVVNCPTGITIAPTTLPTVFLGNAFPTVTFTQTGATNPVTWSLSAGTLPTGMTLSTGGVLSGTPTQGGSFAITVKVTDVNGCFATASMTLLVNGCPTITVNPQFTQLGFVGSPYNFPFSQTGGATPIAWSVSGKLPQGLVLNATTGFLVGIPTESGIFPITVKATDVNGCVGTRLYSLRIDCPNITIGPASMPTGVVGSAYPAFGFTQNGGTPGIFNTWQVTSGTFPPGLVLNAGSGAVTGIPTTAGLFSFVLKFTDPNGCSSSRPYTVRICPVVGLAPPTLPNGVTGTPYSQTVSGTGGVGPYVFALTAGSLPNGLTLTGGTGLIAGTPTTQGVFTFTITATDSNGCFGSQAYTVAICDPPTITPTPAQVCASSTGNTASGPAAQTAYAWTIANGTITSATNIQTITYTAGAAGAVTLNLTVTNASGCTSSSSVTVTINANPAVPVITPTPAQVCSLSTGNTAAGPAGATTYAWTIANGTITSATNIQTITYTAGAAGNVTLNLTVTNASGCATASVPTNVPINANPATPVITPTPAQVCANSTGNTASGPAGATTYAWTIANGTITSATNIQTITYTAGAAGNVTLNLTVTNASGCATASAPTNVPINANPATPVITPTPAQVCAGSAGNTAAGPAGATTYAWTIANGTITSAANIQTITYTAGAAGNVTLNLTVTNASGCSAASAPTLVPINALPATPTITPTPAQVCSNVAGNTASGPAGATTYAWTIANGTITSATNIQTITYTAGAAGNVTLNLTVTNAAGCSAASAPTLVPINALPAVPTITPTPAQVCASSTGNSAAGPAGATTYAWTIVNGTITSAANIQTITYTAGAAGNVTLNLTVTNAAGCSAASAPTLVPINALPAVPTITPTPAQVCANSTGNTAAGPGGATTYAWTIANGTITSATNIQTITYTAGAAGSVTLNLTVTNAAGCAASNSAAVTVNANPAVPVITPTPATVCSNSTGNTAAGPAGATTYAWAIANGTITSATNIQTITYTAGAAGNVTLNLIVTNASGCTTASGATLVPISPLPGIPTIQTDALQTVTVTGGAGTFTLTFNGQTTAAMAFNATPAQVQTQLTALPSVGGVGGTVSVTGAASSYTVDFGGTLTGPQPLMTGAGAGGATVAITSAVCASSAGNQASGPAGATTYAWTIVNGTITSATNIQTITYTAGASGIVTLNLIVTNAGGCANTNSAVLTVNALPAAPTITPTPTPVCGGSAGNTASGPAGASIYAWTIVNGTITSAANIQNITYTAGATGTVDLTLTVTNASGCTASSTVNVPITPGPATPTITPTPTPVCSLSAGNTAAGPAGATSYAWTIANGTITSATNIQTITYTAGAAGNVTLNLTVTNPAGCPASNSILVPIAALPPTPTIATNPQTVTVGGGAGTFTLTFNGQTTPALAFNAAAATVQAALQALSTIGAGNVTVTLSAGVYTVTFTGALAGPQPSLTGAGAGGATVTIGSSTCANSTGNQASGPAGATTYAWTIANGTITSAANIQTITYTAGAAGSVTLNLTVSTGGACGSSSSATIVINANPATPTITPTPATVCGSSTGNTAAGPAGATTYAWTIANGTITSATNIQTITYDAGATGNVTLNLTVTNGSGCPASNSALVPITAAPATPTITTPGAVCGFSTGNSAAGPAGATTYAWTITGGSITSATNIPTITYTAGAGPAPVVLTLTVTNAAGCAASNSATVTVNPKPSIAPVPGALTPGTFGVAYGPVTFTPSPASPNYTFSSPAVPFGLLLSTAGVLSGTPSNTGVNVAMTVTVTDTVTGCSTSNVYTLTVRPNAVAETLNNAVGNTQLVVAGATCPTGLGTPNVCQTGNVLANDAGPATLVACTGACPVTLATTGGGTVSMNANGTFTYTPAVGFTGADTFTYTLTDGNAVTNTVTDTINVASRVWYVNSSAGAGDGRSNTPFNSMTGADTNHLAGDIIFVHTGAATTTGTISLKANTTLWGQGTSLPTVNGSTILNTAAAAKPTLTGTVTVAAAAGVTISSLNISTGAAGGLSASGALGTLTIQNSVAITTSTGTGAFFSNATGTVNANTTSISATGNGTAFSADLGTATINWGGTINSATGRTISITNRTGGVATFTGAVSGTGTGVLLNSNAGSTTSFQGGLVLNTGGFPAFTATGPGPLATSGGTVAVCDENPCNPAATGALVNTLTTTTGTALNVTNTTIGANNLEIRSISANGGANGIFLQNTGATGGLKVVGDNVNTAKGGNATGGTIQGMTGADGATAGNGIYLENTANVSLKRMQLNGFQNSAIRGLSVTGFTLQYSTINGTSGTASGPTEGAVTFGTSNPGGANGLLGTGTIDNCRVSGAVEHNMEFYNQSGTFTLSVTNCDIKSNSVAFGSDGILSEMQGTASATITVDNCDFDDNKSQAVQAAANDSSTIDITINNSRIIRTAQGNEGFVLSNGSNGSLTAHVTNNTITGIGGATIFVGQTAGNATAASNLIAVIRGNTITHPTTATNSAIIAFLTSCNGGLPCPAQSAPANILIDANTVTQNSTGGVSRGIFVDTPDAGTTPGFTATITGNSVAVGDNVAGVNGIAAQARRGTGCFDIRNNTVTFPNGVPGGVVGLRLRQVAPGTANLEAGTSGSAAPLTVLGDNNPGSTREVINTVTVVSNSTCAPPPS